MVETEAEYGVDIQWNIIQPSTGRKSEIVEVIETERRTEGSRVLGRRVGELFNNHEIQFCKMQSSGGWLQNREYPSHHGI